MATLTPDQQAAVMLQALQPVARAYAPSGRRTRELVIVMTIQGGRNAPGPIINLMDFDQLPPAARKGIQSFIRASAAPTGW